MATVGSLVVNLGLNARQFGGGLKSARGMLSSFSSSVTSTVGQMAALGVAGVAAGAALVGLGSAGGAISFGVQAAAQAEQAQVAFGTMLGSANAAKKMMGDIEQFAATTPLDTAGVTSAARTLLQFGVEGNRVLPILGAIGDAAGGDQQRFEAMSLAFGQMSATGRLMGQDLNQMINAGFNPLQEMARTSGKSMGELKQQMEAGGISTAMVEAAFASATSAGGRYFNMMGAQSQTLGGMWAKLKDTVGFALRDIGQAIIEEFDLKGMITNLDTVASSFKTTWLPTVRGVIHQVAIAWNVATQFMGAAWESWIQPAIGMLANFGTNAAILWKWMETNWQTLLKDLLRAYVTYQMNNIRNAATAVETIVRLWTVWQGFMSGIWKQVFQIDFTKWIAAGLKAGLNLLIPWASVAAGLVSNARMGKGPGNEAKALIDQLGKDFGAGKNAQGLQGLGAAMGAIIGEQAQKLRAPLDGFKSELKDLPQFVGTTMTDVAGKLPGAKGPTLADVLAGGSSATGPTVAAGVKKATTQGENVALIKGSQEAMAAIARFRSGGKGTDEKQLAAQQAATKEAREMKQLLREVAFHTGNLASTQVVQGNF
jgi:tape measure domain-containing protein